ncbi:SCY1-like [Cryptococcus neoformans A2-102-5]|nr:SCY1-like [Cryptococcus neoformans var. grubii A2-102-5]
MNYLKSITTSVLQSTGITFPFSVGERIPGLDSHSSIWEIREGVKRDDGTPLTLFIYDSTLPPFQPGSRDRKVLFQLAKNALKKLRTIRHPDIIRYIDSVETETHIYIATERVRPLEGVLRDWETGGALASGAGRAKGKENWIGWGVRSVSSALAFLNSPPLSQHHSYLIPTSIFVTPSLEWRLAGFELLTGKDDAGGILWGLGGVAPGDIGERCAPEVRKGGWSALRETDPAQHDTYLLAVLLFTLYNPHSPLPPLSSQPTPSSSGTLPKVLFPLWKRMLNPNPRTRLTTISFTDEAEKAGFWASNPFVSLVKGLDNFELQSESDKLSLLRIIKEATTQAGTLPGPFTTYKILPSLLHSLSLPTAPSSAMLPLVLELSKLVPSSDYPKMVLDPVVRLYTSPDRGTRMALLEGLNEYVDKLDNKTVTEKIWPNLITGFADTVPVIREATIKAVYPLASKLSDRILNNDLLRVLAKMQMDTEPSIRTNTCILLGRLAPILGHNTKKKVLVPAFARSLKDPFVHARVAGLMALMASVECFDREDLAGKVVPNMSFTLVDKEKLVRDQAFKAMNMFVSKLTDMVKDMPETALPSDQISSQGPVTTTSASISSNQGGAVNSAAGAAGALAGWAISSLGKQLKTSEAHSSMNSSGMPAGFGASAPTIKFNTASSSPAVPASSRVSEEIFRPVSASPSLKSVSPQPRAVNAFGRTTTNSSLSGTSGGMKLAGAKKAPGKSLADQLAGEWEEEDGGNAWGTDDLIDVNAEDDDWSAFESAPVPEVVVPPPQPYYVSAPKPKPSSSNITTSAALRSKPTLSPAISSTSSIPTHAPEPVKPASSTSTPLIPSSPALSTISGAKSPVLSSQVNTTDTERGQMDSASASERSSPQLSVKAGNGTGTLQPNLANMSKEEKEKEMARRREERKAKIAAMKEQKKSKA